MTAYHPLVKLVLDGELSLAELPPDLRAQGEAALRMVAAVDRTPVALPAALETRVMAAVRQRAASPWRRLFRPREVRLRIQPVWALALAAVAIAFFVIPRRYETRSPDLSARVAPESVLVRFVLYAPDAKQVALAGTFNQWNQAATPLVRAGNDGVWTATLSLPVGEHQYAFVVDGRRWVTDPAAPAMDDGFGRRNSVLAVSGRGRAS